MSFRIRIRTNRIRIECFVISKIRIRRIEYSNTPASDEPDKISATPRHVACTELTVYTLCIQLAVRALVYKVGKWPSMAPSYDWVKWALLGYSANCGKSEIHAKFPPTLLPSRGSENAPPPPNTE
jgi:hypothetical protein